MISLRKIVTAPIAYGLRLMGYQITPFVPPSAFPRDFSEDAKKDILAAKSYTMTPIERLVALHQAVQYVVANKIPGDIVECGVWKGGSMMLAAKTLLRAGDTSRDLYLFDTFEGMSRPTASDVTWDGKNAQEMWEQNRNPDDTNRFCYASLDDVKKAMGLTGYETGKIHYVKGKVEATLPGRAPATISLLRLDTDWYESTKHELAHLFPRLTKGGVLILDDYGCWKGAKQAADEYFHETHTALLLNRIDEEARIATKS